LMVLRRELEAPTRMEGDRAKQGQKAGGIWLMGNRAITYTESKFCRGTKQDRMLEPIAAVGYPPAKVENRDCCAERPPERQSEISYQPQDRENDPKDFSFHYLSL